MNRLALTVFAISAFAAAAAQAPDPRCFPKVQPVPPVIDCDAKIDEWIRLRNRYQAAMVSFQRGLELLHSQVGRMVKVVLTDAIGAVNPIPTDVVGGAGCLVEFYCKKAVGPALALGQTLVNTAEVWVDADRIEASLVQQVAEIKRLRAAMEAAFAEAEACLAQQVARNAEIDRVEAANASARAELPKDDPRCKPPTGSTPPVVGEDPRLKFDELKNKPLSEKKAAKDKVAAFYGHCKSLATSGDLSGERGVEILNCFTRAYNNSHVVVDVFTFGSKVGLTEQEKRELEELRQNTTTLRSAILADRNRLLR